MDKKKSRINIQDLGLLAKHGCIMYTAIGCTTDILVCSVCQKLANCTFIPNLTLYVPGSQNVVVLP
jgi:hypothetical protein